MTKARYQNPHAQAGDGLAVAHTMYGERTDSRYAQPHMIGAQEGAVQALPQAHFRNYKAPARRHNDNPDVELCGYEEAECKAYPSKKYHPYCAGHARKLGLLT